MKKFLSLFVIVLLVVCIAVPAYAGAGEKFQNGLKKFVKSPGQICNSVKEEYEAADFKPFGAVGGLMKGLFYGVKDAATGLYEVVTFPINNEDS